MLSFVWLWWYLTHIRLFVNVYIWVVNQGKYELWIKEYMNCESRNIWIVNQGIHELWIKEYMEVNQGIYELLIKKHMNCESRNTFGMQSFERNVLL